MFSYLPLVLRNALRNRRRTGLTVASVAVSLCLLGVLLALYRSLFYGGDTTPGQAMRLVVHHKIALTQDRPGKCTPYACMADNDLALGRIVQALSRSPYWKDTVIFVVEDDAQAGPDHVDSHRSPFYAISAYSRLGTVHRFINTTDVIAAIEDVLGMGRLSKFDYFSRSLAEVFASTPDLTLDGVSV